MRLLSIDKITSQFTKTVSKLERAIEQRTNAIRDHREAVEHHAQQVDHHTAERERAATIKRKINALMGNPETHSEIGGGSSN